MSQTNTFPELLSKIENASNLFNKHVLKQVNVALTLRNWIIGMYIVEYEQDGSDKAQYGEAVLKRLGEYLQPNFKGMSETSLKLYRQFYIIYPQIRQTLSDQLQLSGYQLNEISQTLSDEFKEVQELNLHHLSTPPEKLINHLTFSHIIELIKINDELKRIFYETETISNNWSVRELQRAINSQLFERTGLSTDKEGVLARYKSGQLLVPDDIIRDPYILDFLGLKEKAMYSESDLEEAIINHLQMFLIEMGKGFCFEARQKRITFGNKHYRIDLVFYHRILKCHVLIDLKIGEFTHADSGQMNMYLNYFKKHEMGEGDSEPIGIIMCANKDNSLVEYATTGSGQQILVSEYKINLPSVAELTSFIKKEQERL